MSLYKFKKKSNILANIDLLNYIFIYFYDVEKPYFNTFKVIYINMYDYKNITYYLNLKQKIIILNNYHEVTHIYRFLKENKYNVFLIK